MPMEASLATLCVMSLLFAFLMVLPLLPSLVARWICSPSAFGEYCGREPRATVLLILTAGKSPPGGVAHLPMCQSQGSLVGSSSHHNLGGQRHGNVCSWPHCPGCSGCEWYSQAMGEASHRRVKRPAVPACRGGLSGLLLARPSRYTSSAVPACACARLFLHRVHWPLCGAQGNMSPGSWRPSCCPSSWRPRCTRLARLLCRPPPRAPVGCVDQCAGSTWGRAWKRPWSRCPSRPRRRPLTTPSRSPPGRRPDSVTMPPVHSTLRGPPQSSPSCLPS